MIKVRFFCGCYKPGTGGFFTEPDECTAQGEIVLDLDPEDWDDCGGRMRCPACGASLHSQDGHMERIA